MTSTASVVVVAGWNSRVSTTLQRPYVADPAITACWSSAHTASNEMDVPWRLVEMSSTDRPEAATRVIFDEASSALSDAVHGVVRDGELPKVPCYTSACVGGDDVSWQEGVRWVPRILRGQCSDNLHTPSNWRACPQKIMRLQARGKFVDKLFLRGT